MRATRLINILTTLQARGLVAAGDLAEENSVSLRTIYRDIDELAAAGIPVYSERGPDGDIRTYRVARILALEITGETFERPKDFNLEDYWRKNSERLEAELHPNYAKVRVSKWGYRILTGISPTYVRERMEVSEPDMETGWRVVTLPTGSLRQAVSEFLRISTEIEVLEPAEFRDAMREAARQIAAYYD